MPRNVEIKAAVKDPAGFSRRARSLSGSPPTILDQKDTFFNCSGGRLKLRELPDGSGELICYRRPDLAGLKSSEYLVARISDPDGLKELLSAALGVRGVVRKQRSVFMVGQARVHLDAVVGLGDFMELEVVLREDQPIGEGNKIARQLMSDLGVGGEDLVPGAYIDLLPDAR